MKNILLITAATATLLFTGCTSSTGPTVAEPAEVKNSIPVCQSIRQAESRYEMAKEANIAWRHTGSKIKKAKELAEEANKLALEALYESNEAFKQSAEAEKTWHLAVPQ